jgi:esterase/lipase
MKKEILIICSSILLTSCSIKLESEMFFNKPYSKVRLLEIEKHEITNLNYKTNKISVNDSTKIEVWEISTTNPENIFLLFSPSENSIANSSEIMEKIALETNSLVIGIQYRGYNYSDGNPTLKTSYLDNIVIFNYYKNEFKKYKTVNLIGMSIGTVFIPKIIKNNEDIIDNIFLLSTFSSPEKMLKEIKRTNVPLIARPLIKFKPDKELLEINSVKDLNDYKKGLMIFHAIDDKATGYGMALELYENSNSQKKELISFDDGGHFAPYSDKYLNKVVDSIKSFLLK